MLIYCYPPLLPYYPPLQLSPDEAKTLLEMPERSPREIPAIDLLAR